MILILGSGLAGLSCSYHLGHEECLILEKNSYAFGHVHSTQRDGYTWDEGPHVCFTKSEYVWELFAESVGGQFEEFEAKTTNYYRGHWIDHPAQSNLYQIPEPLRSQCLNSFLESRPVEGETTKKVTNYQEWLEQAFGPVFAETFPAAYTRKYWTCDPRKMGIDWVGGRVFEPKVEDVLAGMRGPLGRQTHYINRIRYPKSGGYQSFAAKLREGANISFGAEIVRIDLQNRKLWTADGRSFSWTRLINTLPLPDFISLCVGLPSQAYEATRELLCSQLLLINIEANHPTLRCENWMYVYDEDLYSTRINCTEKLSPRNAPVGTTGVQVEVYGSRLKPFAMDPNTIAMAVEREVKKMGLVEPFATTSLHTVYVPSANVVFTKETASALECIWATLEPFGLVREKEDCSPLTDWKQIQSLGNERWSLLMAGRFGQWKYFWTDDCVLRGRSLVGAR
ncbi:MAG: FAD-dependent oxidoreductase [bacterium]|nr:FAD-dependent oxidoreductase [bacterium]